MEDLGTLVDETRNGDLTAYGTLVRRFQDLAAGYAYSLLGDCHLAEDAAQEAFVQAYLDLGKLREPAAFPGWFRRIVFKQCDRIMRRKRLPVASLEAIGEVASGDKNPEDLLEERIVKDQVTIALQALPEGLRLVTNLFYIGSYSHREIAAFLGAPVQTVKNRLHASRKRLKKELIDMAREKLQKERPSRNEEFVTHTMDELVDISDRGIQFILRLTDQRDCIAALKGASDAVREKILSNMSERVRTFIEEQMELMKEIDADDTKRAQKAIMDNFWLVRSNPRKPNKEYQAMKRSLRARLRKNNVSRFEFDEIADLFTDLSTIRDEEGILALEEFEELIRQDPDDELLAFGLGRAISGTGGQNVDILEKRMRLLLREQETRYLMIVEGIELLQTARNSPWVRRQLRARYTLEDN